MENTIKFFWNGIKVNGKLNKFRFSWDSICYGIHFYADDYEAEMPEECGVVVVNNSDSMTDYFEKDHGTIYPEHPLFKFFAYAENQARIHHSKNAVKYAERRIEKIKAQGWTPVSVGLIASYNSDIEDGKSRIAALKMGIENPGQPTAADFEKVAAYVAEQKAKAEAEKAAQEAKEAEERAAAYEEAKAVTAATIKTFEAMFPVVEGAPVVEVPFSEFIGLYSVIDAKKSCWSVAAADKILGAIDMWVNRTRENSKYIGHYYKTDFAIKWTENGEECAYRGRYDLGDGEGGMLNHIRNFGEWTRTHGEWGKELENPPETNEVLEMVKKFEAFAA